MVIIIEIIVYIMKCKYNRIRMQLKLYAITICVHLIIINTLKHDVSQTLTYITNYCCNASKYGY